jgi:hypothetical protein
MDMNNTQGPAEAENVCRSHHHRRYEKNENKKNER